MKKILPTEKEMVFLVLLYFHADTDVLLLCNRKLTYIFHEIIKPTLVK